VRLGDTLYDIPITFAGTNDAPAQHATVGTAGVSSVCPCAFCTIRRDQLMVPTLEAQRTTPVQRTCENIAQLCHLTCCICPGCGMQIVEQADYKDPLTQMVKARRGDDMPNKVPKNVAALWRKKHAKELAAQAAEDARGNYAVGKDRLELPGWNELHWGVLYAIGPFFFF
jgi:hypothetical protein